MAEESNEEQEELDRMAADVLANVKEKPGRAWIKRVAVAAVVIGVVVAFVMWRSAKKKRPKYEFITTAADRGDIVSSATATGTLEPERTVTVGAEISGLIESVEVDENEKVTEGQVLARFDTESLKSSLAQARAGRNSTRANLRRAQAGLDEARQELDRLEPLLAKRIVPASQVERARATLARAEADVASARAELERQTRAVELTETNLEKGAIVSPIDGVVLKRTVEPGTAVAASFQAPELFILAKDLTQMELHVAVDEADVGQMGTGLDATFTVDAWPDRTFEAKVKEVSLYPTRVDNVVTYDTVLAVDNSDGALRPGMTATANIVIGQSDDVVRVPNAALRWEPPAEDEEAGFFGPPTRESATHKTNTVWILVDGEPDEREFEPGRTDGRMTEVESGPIESTDPVITSTRALKRGRRR